MCGDSTNQEDVYKLVGGQKVDLLLTDPPYNVCYKGKTKDALEIENDSMPNEEFREFLKKAFIAADNVMKNGAVFYIWHADSEGYNFRGACADVGWKVRECLIWNKSSMVLGRQDYHWKHEPCLYGWKGGRGICGTLTENKQLC
jgi:site-specific DNA-methyltransferase (adenine-specific)